jgi:hypothetical protein
VTGYAGRGARRRQQAGHRGDRRSSGVEATGQDGASDGAGTGQDTDRARLNDGVDRRTACAMAKVARGQARRGEVTVPCECGVPGSSRCR